MIANLRRRHRRLWLLFVFVLPTILLVAWRARRSSPVMDRLPAVLQEESKR